MSHPLISRNPDLARLQSEGYAVRVMGTYLVVDGVPYVNSNREVKRGTLVTALELAGDDTVPPRDHVMKFVGEYPCRHDGTPIEQVRHQSSNEILLPDLVVNHSFSSKPPGGYADYYAKVVSYAAILWGQASKIEPDVTPMTYPTTEPEDAESVFHYADTASARAGICVVQQKLEIGRVVIVGLGGTGSYILDLVAKTPVPEIVLVDGDRFLQHNAFRAPGAPAKGDLRGCMKVDHFDQIYSKMRKGITTYSDFIDESNLNILDGSDFVFICIDSGAARRLIVQHLEQLGIPFIDVGIGVEMGEGELRGIVRVTTSTEAKRTHVHEGKRVPFNDAGDNVYSKNIQVADLNALNAALAVIRWKKMVGFYADLDHEHFCTYTIDGNHLLNEDQP